MTRAKKMRSESFEVDARDVGGRWVGLCYPKGEPDLFYPTRRFAKKSAAVHAVRILLDRRQREFDEWCDDLAGKRRKWRADRAKRAPARHCRCGSGPPLCERGCYSCCVTSTRALGTTCVHDGLTPKAGS